ncbi:hypothetical protein AB4G91_08070 [Macrococcoides goetzii]|uniref:immunodominant staphylococcal antigen IsaB family protein n=1 Tax=Macrococcus sp. PK TaxID=2801919 RepID=UPI001F100E10|nr:hypothetical protein [Macrococcus sp. PK]MCH4984464.1 hypothetical protein [Macrococcus sp. PK]
MKKFGKTIGTIFLSTLLGVGTISSDAEAVTKSEKYVKPHYTYNGYVYNNGKFVLDQYFVKALKYDNVKMNGYNINPKAKVGLGGTPFKKYDVMFLKDSKNRVGHMRFEIKPGFVKKSAFLRAHEANKIVSKYANQDKSGYVKYKTNNANYLASFNSKGYITSMEIGVIPQ